MSGKKSVRVTIVGEDYAIRTERSPDTTRAVAEYVDQAIKSVLNNGSVIEIHKAAILAAMRITDELFMARETSDDLTASMRDLSADIRRLLPPAKRGEGTAGAA